MIRLGAARTPGGSAPQTPRSLTLLQHPAEAKGREPGPPREPGPQPSVDRRTLRSHSCVALSFRRPQQPTDQHESHKTNRQIKLSFLERKGTFLMNIKGGHF